MSIRNDLRQAFESGDYVAVSLDDGAHEGFIVGLSETFVLLQAIYEWQDVGALIIPVSGVEGCDRSDHHDGQVNILTFNSVKRTKRYAWVNLSSMAALFQSLKPKGKFVVISTGDEADIGLLQDIGRDSVDLKAVDPGGAWIDDPITCEFEDITSIQFDDSYSRVLQRYVERKALMN